MKSKDLQIKKWIKEGLTDKEIKDRLQEQVNANKPNPAPPAVLASTTDTIQGTFERVIRTVEFTYDKADKTETVANDAQPKTDANLQTTNKTVIGGINEIKAQVDDNQSGITDYQNNKADFVRLEDITNSTEVNFATPLVMTDDGTDIVIDLTALTPAEITQVESFQDGHLITIQATPHDLSLFPVEYARDSWNDGTKTPNVVLGRDVTVISEFTANGVTPVVRTIKLGGLSQADRIAFIRDFTITSLTQLGQSSGVGIDALARLTANAAQSKADNNEQDIDELNKGNFDVRGDGTKITSIFDSQGDIKESTLATQMGEVYVSGNRQLKEIASTTDDENILATQEYVDDSFNELLTFTYDDGTTQQIKVGK